MPGTILFGIDVETAPEHSLGFASYGAELFHELGVPVTWCLTGKTLVKHPDVFAALEGDDPIEFQAHTYGHLLLKTVLMKIPEGKRLHDRTDRFTKRGASLPEIDDDLARCQEAFETILGRRAVAFTGPWGYCRGLGDRPDILEVAYRHGFRILRTFARDADDGQPVPIEWQPFFYGFHAREGLGGVLELMIHGYQDDFCWRAFTEPREGERYVDYLKSLADRAAADDLTWGLCSHDHGCATREGFEEKGGWFREIMEYAKGLGVRFLTASAYWEEMVAKRRRA